MDVFLVPVRVDLHELYCESDAAHDADATPDADASWWRRQVARFRTAVAEAEAERQRQDRGEKSDRRGIAAWVMGRIAEAVAEQRLLWLLRHESQVTLLHPTDIDGAHALAMTRKEFATDYRRHRNWCGIDALLAAILGPGLFFIPGPNVVGWYFAFRAIGHYFAMKGARHGLDKVTWETRPSPELTSVRLALADGGSECLTRLDEIGARLGLTHLTSFVNRVSRGRRK